MPQYLKAVRYQRTESGDITENLFCIGRSIHLMSESLSGDKFVWYQIMGLCDGSCLHRNLERCNLVELVDGWRGEVERHRSLGLDSYLSLEKSVEEAIRAQPIGMIFYDYCCNRCFYRSYCLGSVHIHETFDYDTDYERSFLMSECDGSCRKTKVVRLPLKVSLHLTEFLARNRDEDPEGRKFLGENGWMF